MIGHVLARIVCFVIGHTDEQNWKTGPRGVSWECQRCFHLTPSRVLVRVK